MLLVILVSVIFIISFVSLFMWIRKTNRKDPKEEKMNTLLTIFVAGVLALLLTSVAAFFWFMFLGSANVVNSLFSLQLSKRELILMSAVYLAFIFTLDNVFQMMIKFLTSKILMFYFLMLWLRMVAFYVIGDFFHLTHYTNIVISGGVALILILFELLYDWTKRKE